MLDVSSTLSRRHKAHSRIIKQTQLWQVRAGPVGRNAYQGA